MKSMPQFALPALAQRLTIIIALWAAAMVALFLGRGMALAADPAQAVAPPPAEANQPAEAEAKPAGAAKNLFIRVEYNDNNQAVGLQTSIVRYRPAGDDAPDDRKDLVVDLVGVVHVGEKEYYEELNKIFEEYDVVLFELVAPEGTVVPKGGGERGGNPISALQGGMQSMLKLSGQLEHVDYTKKNFVHADMTPEEFAKSMQERDNGFFGFMLKVMGESMARGAGPKARALDAQIMAAMFAPDRPVRLKRIMAEQLGGDDDLLKALDGGEEGSAIVAGRNLKALEVFEKQLEAGKKKIAIFYGAAHMPDFDKRLAAKYGLEKTGEPRWLTAWDLTK